MRPKYTAVRHTELKYERQEIQKSKKIKKSKGRKKKEICMENEYEWVRNCLFEAYCRTFYLLKYFILFGHFRSKIPRETKIQDTPRYKLEAKSLVCHGR